MPYKDASKNKECIENWRVENKERKAYLSRKSHIKRKYGLTMEDYDQLSNLWDNKCAICNNPPKASRKSLDIDHCHTHGHVRGVLCDRCNKVLGMFNDNIELLEASIVYLKAYQESLKELHDASHALEIKKSI